MDHESFDRLARLLGSGGSRRAALGAVAGASVLGASGITNAKPRKRKQRSGRDRVNMQAADCFSPGPGSNMNGCDFSGTSLRAMDLSGSTMVGTKFNQADLCGADLSSSQLRNAQFNGAFLFRADLSGSGCRGVQFDADTVFCLTKTCNGAIRNDDCLERDVSSLCCTDADCPAGNVCCQNRIAEEKALAERPRISVGVCQPSCVVPEF